MREEKNNTCKKATTSFALKCPIVNHELASSSSTELRLQQKETEATEKDIISEATILAKLSHKNIIKAIGMSYGNGPAMLLLELLDCTLSDKLEIWRKEQKQLNNTSAIKVESRIFLR